MKKSNGAETLLTPTEVWKAKKKSSAPSRLLRPFEATRKLSRLPMRRITAGVGTSGNGFSHSTLTNANQFSEWQWVTTRSHVPAYPF
ncbi:MAG: benzaldehyde dehydrogenase [Gammaproteobacteria bacterium]|nr:benzaldehyde dehydrogenase [Gammaproteobacteria bacterium]